MHPQEVKICITAWIILKSQMFVAPVNQKSDRSIFFYTAAAWSQPKEFHWTKDQSPEPIRVISKEWTSGGLATTRALPNSTFFCCWAHQCLSLSPVDEKHDTFLKLPNGGFYFLFQGECWWNLNESSHIQSLDSWFASSSCLCFVDLMLLFVTVWNTH